MTREPLAIVLAAAAILNASCGAAADARHPAVVELYTSQGCSSCPPANDHLARLADRPDVIALSFNVTYWDSLGWKDTFADPRYTARQWDYAHAWRRPNVYTPQTVVNGRIDASGAQPGQMEALLVRGARTGGPEIVVSDGAVTINAAPSPARPAQVWVVRYDPATVNVPVRAGENGGRSLPHRNVVHELTLAGTWSGRTASFRLPPPRRPGLATAILVQDGAGGMILAAAKA